MGKKIILTVFLVTVIFTYLTSVHASMLNTIIDNGNGFGNGTGGTLGTDIDTFIKGNIVPAIGLIGNLIFAAVTVILGAKYIWSSAEGRSQVLESLPGFVLAVIFFYLGETLVTWLTDAGSSITGAPDWTSLAGKIIWIVNTIVYYAAFAGILVLGLKYMFASAEGKSKLKANMGALVLGIVFVFSASKVVDFIINIGSSALQ